MKLNELWNMYNYKINNTTNLILAPVSSGKTTWIFKTAIKEKSNKIPPVKSSINLLSTLKKSMGDEENGNNTNETPKQKDLELTDDLFNLIDSMYDEGKD